VPLGCVRGGGNKGEQDGGDGGSNASH
jgi:hypothetical protein